MTRFRRDDAAFAATDAYNLDAAGLVVVPRDIGDAASIARKSRIAFEFVPAGQALRVIAAAVGYP